MAILACEDKKPAPGPLVKTALTSEAMDDRGDHHAELERLREALNSEISKRKQVRVPWFVFGSSSSFPASCVCFRAI